MRAVLIKLQTFSIMWDIGFFILQISYFLPNICVWNFKIILKRNIQIIKEPYWGCFNNLFSKIYNRVTIKFYLFSCNELWCNKKKLKSEKGFSVWHWQTADKSDKLRINHEDREMFLLLLKCISRTWCRVCKKWLQGECWLFGCWLFMIILCSSLMIPWLLLLSGSNYSLMILINLLLCLSYYLCLIGLDGMAFLSWN